MRRGESFEIECWTYLTNKYGSDLLNFVHHDTSDSTGSDIEVFIKGHSKFFIEAKDSQAQSGQFVLMPDEENRVFIFSSLNKSESNAITDIIIEYMNLNFDKFNNAGTAGELINLDSRFFDKWIVGYYKNKGVRFVISKHNNMVILPIEKFSEYFNISATYRIKQSGSGDPAKKDINKLTAILSNRFGVSSRDINIVDKKVLVKINDSIDNNRFCEGKYTYYLSKTEFNNTYRLKRLSNTRNMTVIFSIEIMLDQQPEDLEFFESVLLAESSKNFI